jgi:hypothetical protein
MQVGEIGRHHRGSPSVFEGRPFPKGALELRSRGGEVVVQEEQSAEEVTGSGI